MVSAYVVSVLLSNAVYHLHETTTASDLSERERLGNKEMFTVSPTLSGYSVRTERFKTKLPTVWNIRGAL